MSNAVQRKARRNIVHGAAQGAAQGRMQRSAGRREVSNAAQSKARRNIVRGAAPACWRRTACPFLPQLQHSTGGEILPVFSIYTFPHLLPRKQKNRGDPAGCPRLCENIFAGPDMLRHGRRAKIRARRRGTVRHRYGSARGTAQHWVRRGTGTAQKTLEGSRFLPVRPALSFPFAGRDAKRTLACMGHLFSSCAVMTV